MREIVNEIKVKIDAMDEDWLRTWNENITNERKFLKKGKNKP